MDKTIIKQKILSAPEDIKEIVSSLDIVDLAEKNAQENKLTEDQETALGKEILYATIGITKLTDFPTKIGKILNVSEEIAKNIASTVNEKIFSRVKDSLEKMQSSVVPVQMPTAPAPKEPEHKDDILHGIENPAPVKPIIINPAGTNIVLDAQHNLPEKEKRVLIGSSAVPPLGPMIGNFKSSPIKAPVAPIIPTIKPVQPIVQVTPLDRPLKLPQNPVAPKAPMPPAPKNYTTDPYREPAV